MIAMLFCIWDHNTNIEGRVCTHALAQSALLFLPVPLWTQLVGRVGNPEASDFPLRCARITNAAMASTSERV